MGRPALALVHSPLVGASAWEPVAEVLHARGHATVVPSLAEVSGGSAPYYPRLAATIARQIDGQSSDEHGSEGHGGDGQVVLVGHSGAGALLPAVVDATKAAVVGTIFVDALLPHPGRSWFETVPEEMRELASQEGLLPPWNEWFPPGAVEELLPDPALRDRFCEELPRLPLSYFEELAPDLPPPVPSRSAYLRLSDAYETEAQQAARDGWLVTHRSAHHLALLTAPQEISATLAECIDSLSGKREGGP